MKKSPKLGEVNFFPRQKLFWALHCCGLAALVFAQLLVNALSLRNPPYFIVAGQMLWLPYFTFAVLVVRWFYKRQQWPMLPIVKLIGMGVAGSLFASIFVVLATIGSMWIIFLPEMQAYISKVASHLSLFEFLQRAFVRNLTMAGPNVLIWCFIYVSVDYWRRIKEAELRALQHQHSLKEAQLANLSGQLNPHFLFNALNNIRFLIYENADKAGDALTTLSEVLRHSLKANTSDKIPLSRELEFIEKYLALARLQLESRLVDKLVVSEGVQQCLVPPLMLQLLVENAIKHGVEHMVPSGRLHVEITTLGDEQLSIKVCNDKPNQESELLSNLGIGLNNIRSRLRLIYGDTARMVVKPSDDLFCVHIVLPMELAA